MGTAFEQELKLLLKKYDYNLYDIEYKTIPLNLNTFVTQITLHSTFERKPWVEI